MKNFLVIRNPVAGRRKLKAFRYAIARIEAAGGVCGIVETMAAGDATRIAQEANETVFDAVVVAGGDGSINEAINGLAGRRGRRLPLPLGILPLGTANVLAHEIGVGGDIDRAADTITAGRRLPIALAKVLFEQPARYASLMVSAGSDARAMTRLRPRLKRLLGKGAYYTAGLEEIVAGSRALLTVEIDGKRFETASVIVANGRFYGGGFVCAPDADIAEPLLQVVMLKRTGRWHAIRYGLALTQNRLFRLRDVEIVAGTTVRILAPDGQPVQADGDLIGPTPIEITVEAKAIELLAPA